MAKGKGWNGKAKDCKFGKSYSPQISRMRSFTGNTGHKITGGRELSIRRKKWRSHER